MAFDTAALWDIYRPKPWALRVAAADPYLLPGFALADLGQRHWRMPALWRLLAPGFMWMGLHTLLIALGVALQPGRMHAELWTYLAPALAFFALTSMLGSWRLGPVFGAVYAGVLALQTLLMWSPFPPMSGLPPAGVAALMASGTTTGILVLEYSEDDRRRPLRTRMHRVWTYAGAGSILVMVTFGLPALMLAARLSGLLPSPTVYRLSVAIGLSAALTSGVLAWWRTRRLRRSLIWGALFGLLVWGLAQVVRLFDTSPLEVAYLGDLPLAYSAGGLLEPIAGGLLYSSLFVAPYSLAQRATGSRGGTLAGFAASTLGWFCLRLLTGGSLLTQLSLFLPLLVFLSIIFTLTIVLSQWRPAQAAQIELVAGQLERCGDIAAIAAAHHNILVGDVIEQAGPALRPFNLISSEIAAALNHTGTYSTRLALSAVLTRLEDLTSTLEESRERYAARLYPIAARWRQIVAQRLQELAYALEQDIINPYVVGVPLTEQDEIFVGRTDIAARLEQSLRGRHSPPILLYGQRRMGKSSLLLNLARLLPTSVVPLYVDGQAVAGAADYAEFLCYLANQMRKSAHARRRLELPEITLEALRASPFMAFDGWLDLVEARLKAAGCVGLLALDEFEVLNRLLDKRFEATDFTNLLRHLIQHRAGFKFVMAGSHTLEEFHALAGALINLQVLKLERLEPDEALRLVEHPVQDFPLAYTPEASAALMTLAQGHPYLLQLICYEMIWLKNMQELEQRYLAEARDVAAAAARALQTGSAFFAALQTEHADAVPVLTALAGYGPGARVTGTVLADTLPQEVPATLRLLEDLAQRDVLDVNAQGYAFQIELIRRWFAGRAGRHETAP